MREGPTVTDSRSWHRLICSLCPLCPGHDTKLHPRRGPKWASRAYRLGQERGHVLLFALTGVPQPKADNKWLDIVGRVPRGTFP